MLRNDDPASLRRAVKDNYEQLEADMDAVVREWEAVRAAYKRIEGSVSEPDASGEWEMLQETSDSLVRALDDMLQNTYTRLPHRVSTLRGKVMGFALAVSNARRQRRRARPAPVPPERTG